MPPPAVHKTLRARGPAGAGPPIRRYRVNLTLAAASSGAGAPDSPDGGGLGSLAMRRNHPPGLNQCVKDFVFSIDRVPAWVDEFASTDAAKGHYEWNQWVTSLQAQNLWKFGGPWRVLVADLRLAKCFSSVEDLHKLKDKVVYAIVDRVYRMADARTPSGATQDKHRKRVQSVYSKQNKHPVTRHSLLAFLDFAFALSAHEEFVARRFDTRGHFEEPESVISRLRPTEVTPHAVRLETSMLEAGYLPFYLSSSALEDTAMLSVRQQVLRFCDRLPAPLLTVVPELRNVRGLKQKEKLGDCTTEWIERLKHGSLDARWRDLLDVLIRLRDTCETTAQWEGLLYETSRAISAKALSRGWEITNIPDDVLPVLACRMAEMSPVFRVQAPNSREWQTVTRVSFRGLLDWKMETWEREHGIRGLSVRYMDQWERMQARRHRSRQAR